MFRDNIFKATAIGVLLACGSLLSVTAQAAAASATAQIFDLTDNAGILSFSNYSYLLDASTPLHSGTDIGSSPTTIAFTDTSGSNVSYAEAGVEFDAPVTHAGVTNSGRGSSTAAWYLDWQASTTGTVSLDLSYLSSWTVANLAVGETGVASSFVSMIVDGTPYKSEVLNFYSNVNGNNFVLSDLLLSFDVTAGQKGSISIATASNALAAPVPLPAGIWLFGSAFVGLARFVRRKA